MKLTPDTFEELSRARDLAAYGVCGGVSAVLISHKISPISAEDIIAILQKSYDKYTQADENLTNARNAMKESLR